MADTAEDLDWEHIGDGVEVAFIALHGAGDEDGVIQAQLEKVGLPYTGSGIASSDLCWDKWAYKEFLSEKQIPLTQKTKKLRKQKTKKTNKTKKQKKKLVSSKLFLVFETKTLVFLSVVCF